jgi:hypothetical protein
MLLEVASVVDFGAVEAFCCAHAVVGTKRPRQHAAISRAFSFTLSIEV